MRPTTPATISRLARSTPSSESASIGLRARQRPVPCIFCAQRVPQHLIPRVSSRSQSTASSTTPQKEDTNAPPQTHYTFFPRSLPSGPPPHGQFSIDLSALKKEFLQLQSKAHPDLHPSAHKQRAQALSARINEAYKTLQSPLLRAQYLLSLRGIEVADDETAKVEDPELLMEVLETREMIEEAGSEEELADLKIVNDARIGQSVKILEDTFSKDDTESAKNEAVKLRYWINIKDSLDGWEKGKPVVLQH